MHEFAVCHGIAAVPRKGLRGFYGKRAIEGARDLRGKNIFEVKKIRSFDDIFSGKGNTPRVGVKEFERNAGFVFVDLNRATDDEADTEPRGNIHRRCVRRNVQDGRGWQDVDAREIAEAVDKGVGKTERKAAIVFGIAKSDEGQRDERSPLRKMLKRS